MAKYKYNTLAKENIEWVAGSGHKIKVTVSLEEETWDLQGNGEFTPTKDSLSIKWELHINGEGQGHQSGLRQINDKPGFTHAIDIVAISTENVKRIRAAEDKIEDHPSWVSKIEARRNGEKLNAEYQEHVEKVENAMTLNGRSY